MNRTEFFLRLLLMRGRRPAREALFWPDFPAVIASPRELLMEIGCHPTQITAFFQVDEARLARSLAWINDNSQQYFIPCCDRRYPELLRQIADAPLALFVEGNAEMLNQLQFAMVGSRRYSPYGRQWGYHFAYELASQGVVITSGLALGIDSVCHGAALDAGGKTLAVLGSGLCHITPKSHLRLANEILEKQGALVSEFLPDEKALPQHFPRRNRIISGLSAGVMVIEAAIKSGSLITAKCALEQGRDVFALPGAIDNPGSEGTNWLIQQGAYLAAKPDDVMAHLSGALQWFPSVASALSDHTEDLPADCPYPHLIDVLSSQPMEIDRIAEWVDLPITDVMVQLVELELAGFTRAVSGGYVRNLTKLSA